MAIGYVYKITLPNGYCYVGSHKSAAFDEDYWGSSENANYWKALFKAGKENVTREVLSWHDTEAELITEEYNQIQLCPLSYNTAHLRMTKEKRKEKALETKRELLLARLSKSKDCLVYKLTMIDNEYKRVKEASLDEIDKIDGKLGLYQIGRKSWNFGKTKETDKRLKKAGEKLATKEPWNKGKTFEEMFGKERAVEVKQQILIHNTSY